MNTLVCRHYSTSFQQQNKQRCDNGSHAHTSSVTFRNKNDQHVYLHELAVSFGLSDHRSMCFLLHRHISIVFKANSRINLHVRVCREYRVATKKLKIAKQFQVYTKFLINLHCSSSLNTLNTSKIHYGFRVVENGPKLLSSLRSEISPGVKVLNLPPYHFFSINKRILDVKSGLQFFLLFNNLIHRLFFFLFVTISFIISFILTFIPFLRILGMMNFPGLKIFEVTEYFFYNF